MPASRGRPRGARWILGIAAVGWLARVAYVVAQPASDPHYAAPILDGRYYLDWARAIAGSGGEVPEGAYYLAPLYPWILAVFVVTGVGFAGLYVVQHAAVAAAAIFAGLAARSRAGDVAGVAATGLVLAYGPGLYFASRPLGEALASALLAGATAFALGCAETTAREAGTGDRLAGVGSALVVGGVLGLATLARPNLLLVAAFWLAAFAIARRHRTALAMLVGLAIVLAPVALRNRVHSGHWVPVSSNAGITLYHGNGPGALGVYTAAAGFSGTLAEQRAEATAIAAARAGRDFDAVEADRYWGREALRVRAEDFAGTARLVARRVALTTANAELGLDYAPALDDNPWRRVAPVPFAVVAGLAAAALVAPGWRRSGGPVVWGAVLACAATPVLFYVSSRYRLPMAILAAIPAGAAVAALVGHVAVSRRRRAVAAGVAVVVAATSFAIPTGSLRGTLAADALALRGLAWSRLDARTEAVRDFDRALAADPESVVALHNYGVALARFGDPDAAAGLYRRALAVDPTHVESAGNLAGLLIDRGAVEDAIPPLERALAARPGHVTAWTNLVVCRMMAGDVAGALESTRSAAEIGVTLDPVLVAEVERAYSADDGSSGLSSTSDASVGSEAARAP